MAGRDQGEVVVAAAAASAASASSPAAVAAAEFAAAVIVVGEHVEVCRELVSIFVASYLRELRIRSVSSLYFFCPANCSILDRSFWRNSCLTPSRILATRLLSRKGK